MIIIFLLFVILNLCLLSFGLNGPFFDEAIYIVSGLRTFTGNGLSDNYLTWFKGSLLWPVLSGIGFEALGLAGSRLMALFFATVTLVAVSKATKNLFNSKVSFWATLALALNGPFLAISHLAVYDLPALAGIAISFLAISEFFKREKESWLIFSAIAFIIGVFAKYPSFLMITPIFGLIFYFRRRKALQDIGLYLVAIFVVVIFFLSPIQDQVSQVISWSLQNSPTFGSHRLQILFDMFFYSFIPVILGFVSIFIFKKNKKSIVLPIILFSSLAIWPCYHFFSGNPVSDNKHIVLGFLFVYPLVGITLEKMWTKNRFITLILVVLMAVLGFMQMRMLDYSWPDTRKGTDYLIQHVDKKDQKFLINDSWPYIASLLANDKISSPWAVHDTYSFSNNILDENICNYDWFIDEEGSFQWDISLKNQIAKCNSFEAVYTFSTHTQGLQTNLQFVTYPITTTIWKNIHKETK